MKRIILFLFVILFLAVGCSKEENKEEGNKVLYVGTKGESYPTSFEKDDQLTGFDVELTKKIAENLGYKIKWTKADVSGLFGSLESNKIDTIANDIAITRERKEKYNFTKPYSHVSSQIVVNKGNKNINKLEDLNGKTVGGALGSNHTEALEKYIKEKSLNIKIRTYETRDGALRDVLNGRLDGYVNSNSVLTADINKKDMNLKFIGNGFNDTAIGYPFKPKDENIKKEFDKEIKKLQKNGEITKLSKRFFGYDITEEN